MTLNKKISADQSTCHGNAAPERRATTIAVCSAIAAIIAAGSVSAGTCDERIKKRKTPQFPSGTSAVHTLIRDGACTVAVAYSLTSDGKPTVVSSVAPETRCKAFEKSARKAVTSSSYTKGAVAQSCEWHFTFELETDPE